MRLATLTLATAPLWAASLHGCGDDEPDPSKLPVISRFAADPAVVATGARATLSWAVENAARLSIEASPGGSILADTAELSGSLETGPIQETTKFTLTAINDEGQSTRDLIVSIDDAGATIVSFAANPNPGRLGGRSTLQWVTARATQLRILRGTEVLLSESAAAASGSLEVTLSEPVTLFTLEARNDQTQARRELTVTAEAPPTIRRFEVSPRFFLGASVDVSLEWETENASSLSLTANGVVVPGFTATASGSATLPVSENTVFVLRAESAGGLAEESRSVEQTVGEAEPNDELDTANGLGAGGSVEGTIAPDSDVDLYRVTVPAGHAVFAETSDGQGGCALDTQLALLDAAGSVLTSDDDGGAASSSGSGACSLIDPRANLDAAELPAGTYYLRVSAFEAGPYHLLVQVIAPGCGNGVWEAGRGEQCDDGNTDDSDGCSSSCALEVEGFLSGPPAEQTFSGTASSLQYSFYVLQVTSPAYVDAKLYAPTAPDCPIDFAELALFDAQGVEQTYDFVLEGCPHINPAIDPYAYVTPGLYVLGVGFYGEDTQTFPYSVHIALRPANACGNGVVESGEQCDDGNVATGDGCNAQCRIEPRGTLAGPAASASFTDVAPGDLLHFYELNLSGEAYVEAAVFAPSAPECSGGADPVVYLADSALAPLGFDDDTGPEQCSHLFPAFTEDARLAAGRYFVAAGFRGDPSVSYAYELQVSVHAVDVCGNGMAESGEQCDDGNLMDGDGCSAACEHEIAATIEPPGGTEALNLQSAIGYGTLRVNVTQGGQSLTATTASGLGCERDNTLSLYAPDGASLLGRKIDGLLGPCAEITLEDEFANDLPIGAHLLVLRAEPGGAGLHRVSVGLVDASCGNGRIERNAGEACDDGNLSGGDGCSPSCAFEGPVLMETEPNDLVTSANASGASLGVTQTIAGRIYPVGDSDFYELILPSGAPRSLVARTYTQFGDPSICDAIDTELRLYDAGGALVAENDDSGAVAFTTCSEISEASMPGRGLDALAPGTYFLEVRRYEHRQTIRQYLLDVRLD